MNDDTRLIRASENLFDFFGTRADDGRKLTYEWGEPVAECGIAPGIVQPIYEPTLTATDDGTQLVTTERLAEALDSLEVGEEWTQTDLAAAVMEWLKARPVGPVVDLS